MTPPSEHLSEEYLATLLKKDARDSSLKYSALGLNALLPKRATTHAPKANTRFLKNIIRETNSHNAALKLKELEEAGSRLRKLRGDPKPSDNRRYRDQEREEDRERSRKRRRLDYGSSEEREGMQKWRDRPKRSRDDHNLKRDKGRRRHRHCDDSDNEADSDYRRIHRRRRTESNGSRSGSHSRSTERHRRSYCNPDGSHSESIDRQAGCSYRDGERRSIGSYSSAERSRVGREHHGSRSRFENHVRERSRTRSTHRSIRQEKGKSTKRRRSRSPRFDLETAYNKSRRRKNRSPAPIHHHTSTHNDPPLESPIRISMRSPASDSDPLESFLGPLPPPPAPPNRPRGRGAHTVSSAIDAHFSATYDPTTDVAPSALDEDDWDQALEAIKDRARWKQMGAERLRAAGFSVEEVSKWEKGGERGAEDVRWRGRGEGREWDRGKAVEDDGVEFGRLIGT